MKNKSNPNKREQEKHEHVLYLKNKQKEPIISVCLLPENYNSIIVMCYQLLKFKLIYIWIAHKPNSLNPKHNVVFTSPQIVLDPGR